MRFVIPTDTRAVARLEAAYRRAQGERRRKALLLAGALLAAVLASACAGEVDPWRLAANIHKFPTYIGSILPQLRLGSLWSDVAEWYWG
ncbi:MAG: phosphonate ABC transporter, permease protein PhnE, partial [Alphaproteobacteria bacterium]|nr:phosphonate ABC transporter, permease protein PhnE [Alphaproteobacteria bacterium]